MKPPKTLTPSQEELLRALQSGILLYSRDFRMHREDNDESCTCDGNVLLRLGLIEWQWGDNRYHLTEAGKSWPSTSEEAIK